MPFAGFPPFGLPGLRALEFMGAGVALEFCRHQQRVEPCVEGFPESQLLASFVINT